MEIGEALKIIGGQFNKIGIKNPALEAEILLSHILKKTREFLLSYPNKKISEKQNVKFKALAKRRKKGEPIAYLIGSKEFYGLNFIVNKNTLIPRPETELMVEEALALITHSPFEASAKEGNAQPASPAGGRATLVDVGTGSGCIIIALAKQISDVGFRMSDFESFAVDISKPALDVAKKNAKLHKVDKQIKFLQGNLLEPIIKNKKLSPPQRDPAHNKKNKVAGIIENCKLIIVANLPYLTPTQIKSSFSIKHEPKLALDGGEDGLKYYRKLFKEVNVLTKRNPASLSLLCEIDPSQASKIKKLANEFFNGKIKIIKDLSKRNRICSITVLD